MATKEPHKLSPVHMHEIGKLQQAIWKAEELIKLSGADELSFIFIQASAIIEVLEQQIESIWNGN